MCGEKILLSDVVRDSRESTEIADKCGENFSWPLSVIYHPPKYDGFFTES
jgi:hypothetical protein